MQTPTQQSRDSIVDELEVSLNSLASSGNLFFSKILKSMDEPYSSEQAQKDFEALQKLLKDAQDGFKKTGLTYVRTPKFNINNNQINLEEQPFTLEELVKKSQEQINSAHQEMERLRKNTNVCRTRITDVLCSSFFVWISFTSQQFSEI